MNEFKIFELKSGETIWICAHTNIEALKIVFSNYDMGLDDLGNDEEIIEVPKEKWDKIKFTDEDKELEQTFAEYMESNPSSGIICGTMY